MTEPEFLEKLERIIQDGASTWDSGQMEQAAKRADCAMQACCLFFEYLSGQKARTYGGSEAESAF